MKKTFVLFGILTVFLLSCISLGAKTKKKIINLNETSWELLQITKRGKEQLIPQNANITINFADNKINGNSGVNSYFGGYKIKNNSILTANAATTLMAGPENLMKIEFEYLKLLQDSKTIKLNNNILILTTSDGKVLKFEKIDDRAYHY